MSFFRYLTAICLRESRRPPEGPRRRYSRHLSRFLSLSGPGRAGRCHPRRHPRAVTFCRRPTERHAVGVAARFLLPICLSYDGAIARPTQIWAAAVVFHSGPRALRSRRSSTRLTFVRPGRTSWTGGLRQKAWRTGSVHTAAPRAARGLALARPRPGISLQFPTLICLARTPPRTPTPHKLRSRAAGTARALHPERRARLRAACKQQGHHRAAGQRTHPYPPGGAHRHHSPPGPGRAARLTTLRPLLFLLPRGFRRNFYCFGHKSERW